MPIEILMPALSPTMKDGKLASWLKKEGDKVSAGDLIAEIETDKAIMELDTPFKGTIGKILVQAGSENVTVGTLIALLLKDGEDVKTLDGYVSKGANNEAKQASAPDTKEQVAQASCNASTMQCSVSQNTEKSRQFISPLARNIAANNNIKTDGITGSGPNGRIVKADIEAILNSGSGSTVNTKRSLERNPVEYTEMAASSMRKVIAKRLTESKQSIPHFYIEIDINMDNVISARAAINDLAKKDKNDKPEYSISINDFIIKACGVAMGSNPDINSSWQNEKIIKFNNVDVCVAVSTPTGLITPIVQNTDQKSIFNISSDVKSLALKAREGKLQPNEYNGGGITISNMGMFGIPRFTAIINPPQACILAVGAVEKRAIVINDNVSVASMCTIAFSADHRIIDGATLAKFANDIKRLLENPILMFAI